MNRNVDLASAMVRLRCESLPERLLIPAFVFFFFKLYPPRWIADPRSSTAGAAGGCILIKSSTLRKIGGVEAIRGELIDDCALAAKVKPHGSVWLGLSNDTRSIRAYDSFATIWNMVARTAFTQLHHSSLLLAGTVAGMFITYIVPPLFALQGLPAAVLAWLAMSFSYAPYASLLSAAGFARAASSCDCSVLYGSHHSFRHPLLARRGWAMERSRAGFPLVNFYDVRWRSAAGGPPMRSIGVVLRVEPFVQRR